MSSELLPELALPKGWPRHVRSAVLNAVSMASATVTIVRGWWLNSRIARVRMAAELEVARNEISLLKEELRIKDARLARIDPRRRPHYPPTERMAILELRAARGWSLTQAANAFHVTADTVSSWMRRLDEQGPSALVQTPEPVNRFGDLIRHLVQRLKVLNPCMGKKRIAKVLARAGLHLATTTVGRMLKEEPLGPPPGEAPAEDAPEAAPRIVTARYPNHVWHVDLTATPTALGFWIPWLPFALPQCWPFCWWIAIAVDHYSRKVVAYAVFGKRPNSVDVRAMLGRAIAAIGRAPRYIVCDRDRPFDCPGFRAWCRRKRIMPPRYGAVGKHGSIAVVERLIRSMKDECLRRIIVPMVREKMHAELAAWVEWYNEHRPHEFLGGRTPNEVYSRAHPANRNPRWEPRPKWPKRSPCAAPRVPVKGRRGVRLELVVSYLEGRRHLPVVEIRRSA